MFRVLLTLVLTALVALPHGICFCHWFEATPSCLEPICCATEVPPTPEESPGDDDADCPCKLREVLAAHPTPVSAERGGAVDFASLYSAGRLAAAPADLSAIDSSAHFRTVAGPLPLILCALRI